MSSLSAALAAFLQNDNTIGPLITGIIADRNFDDQEHMLTIEPKTCIAVSDLIEHQSPYIGTAHSGNTKKMRQIEVRIISRVSKACVDSIKDAMIGNDTASGVLWTTTSLPASGSNLPFGMVDVMSNPGIDQPTKTWYNILTIICKS
jgi:hypothetical protein